MVLYRPKEPQKYEYYTKDQTEVYWVHFTGNNVTNLLRSYGLTNKKVFHCGSGAEYQNLFRSMIKELQMCQDGYEEMLEIYLRQIFIKLQRHFKSSLNSDNSHAFEEIDNAISYFCEHYNEPINIDDYIVVMTILCILAVFFKRQKEYRLLNIAKTYHNVYSILLLYKFCIKNRDTL